MKIKVQTGPGRQPLPEVDDLVEEKLKAMGMNEPDFSVIQVLVAWPENDGRPETPCQQISVEAVYRARYSDDQPGNTCWIMIELERFGDFWFGRFRIYDPRQGRQKIAWSVKDLGFGEFARIMAKACQLGCLPAENRLTWWKRAGWRDLLPLVAHLQSG